MKHIKFIVSVMMLLIMLTASFSCASEEVKGRVGTMTDSYISIVTKGGAAREFEITRETRIFREGEPLHIRHILPNSQVRIVSERGKAEAIFIQEVPK